jgi:tetratricopeptide (TPR) repeat protein
MRASGVLLLMLCSATALADGKHGKTPPAAPKPPPEPEAPKPWAVGVPQENQDKAIAIYKEGNVLLEQSQYKEALEKFTAALAFWDHPAIHYNAGLCLINLDRPVDAYEHIVASLKYGEAPIGSDLFVKGQTYQEMLGRQIGEVDITPQVAGAEVSLDGEPVTAADGTFKKRVKSGEHQIVTQKPGFVTETKSVNVGGGAVTQVTIVMKPIPHERKLVRRWSKERPYEVAGAGAVVALASLPFFYWMSNRYAGYRSEALQLCSTGCYDNAIPAKVDDERSRGDRDQMIAWSVLGVGTAVVVTGVVGALFNSEHFASPVQPMVGADKVGLAISGSW